MGQPAQTGGWTIGRVGFWSAILTTLWAVAFTLAFVGQAIASPPTTQWQGIEDYARSFSSVHMALTLVPSLLLAPSFVALTACLHGIAPAEKKVWTRIGVGFSLVYAILATVNYTVQLIVVRGSLLAGETEGLALLAMGNPRSLFWGLALVCYNIYMAVAGLLVVPALGKGRLARWTGRLFAINAIASIPAAVIYFVTLNPFHPAGLIASAGWCLAFPAATALLAVHFRRRLTGQASP